LWKAGGAWWAARRIGADAIFSPTYQTIPVVGIPAFPTIHDVAVIRSPSFAKIRNTVQKAFHSIAAKTATKIFTNSECSKRDIVELLNVPEERVRAVPFGYDSARFHAGEVDCDRLQVLLSRWNIRRPYIIHHGTVQPRKNLKRLIEAYDALLSSCPSLEVDLILAGDFGWEYQDILAAAARVTLPARVVFTGALVTEELSLLVRGATLCVMPSLYEGFCFPMVEAMASGVPTIASNTSCLPEISKGVLHYFNPESHEQIAAAISKALQDTNLRRQLRDNGIRVARSYNWERCAQEILGTMREVHKGKRH
jgi:glycosyltransferase involved in cell wall biosynthesis